MASETQKLVELQNGEPTTTSLQVAQASGKKHKVVLEAIDKIIKDLNGELAETSATLEMFKEESYIHEQNHQKYRMFVINKNGWIMLMGSFVGSKYTLFRFRYMLQFNAMEKYIQEQQQQQFFAPETVDQQIKREQLAIAKDNSNNAKSREVRSWLKLMKNKPEAVEMAAPKVMSILLDLPEEQLQIEPAHRYIYSAEEIGKRLGVDAYAIGIAAQKLGLKATRKEHQNRWSQNNLVGATSNDQKSRWMYTEEAFKEIKSYLEV